VNRTASGQLLTVYKICWQACCASLAFHSSSRVFIIGRIRCCSNGPKSTSWQEWDRVIAEATQLVRFVPSIDPGSGCLNTAWHREKNGQEPYHAVPALRAAFPMVRLPVVAVIVHIGTVNRRLFIVKAVAHKDPGGDRQWFPPKHLLQTAIGIVFLERNVNFHQPMCAGYEYSKSHSVWSMLHPSTTLGWESLDTLHASCCSSHSQNALRRS
jgi:hypothetical protein